MKTYTIEDIKIAFEDGYYEGVGDDAWYRDHDDEGQLKDDASVHRYIEKHLEVLKSKEID